MKTPPTPEGNLRRRVHRWTLDFPDPPEGYGTAFTSRQGTFLTGRCFGTDGWCVVVAPVYP